LPRNFYWRRGNDENDENDENEENSQNSKNKENKENDENEEDENEDETTAKDLKGDVDDEYDNGQIVWAKHLEFPWWPAKVELAHRQNTARGSSRVIPVTWFGDYGATICSCAKTSLIPFDEDLIKIIREEVQSDDMESFDQSVQQAIKMTSQFDKKNPSAKKTKKEKKTKKNENDDNKNDTNDENDKNTENDNEKCQ